MAVMSPIRVLVRTPDYAVVDKPSGLTVHRSRGSTERVFALQLVRDLLGQRVHPVHRIDRGASGCLLFALSSSAARELQAAMSDPQARKTYIALCRGRWTAGEGPILVDNPMKDDNRRLKDAATEVLCLATTAQPRCSLVRARPRTGRYHQVRRHVRDLNHPVIGDSQHGDTKFNRVWRDQHGLARLALHCHRLELPAAGIDVACPLPEDLAGPLRRVPFYERALREWPDLFAGAPPCEPPSSL